jgi:thioredoxin-related protein
MNLSFFKRSLLLAALVALVAAPFVAPSAVRAAEVQWHTNMDEAMKIATREDKQLLINFTGSDWCVWCKRLEGEVFEQSQFQEEATDDFVLVELDFPRSTPQSDEVKKHNRKWQEQYGVEGFPTIVLANAKGEAFANTGYLPGGPGPYMMHLDELLAAKQTRDEALAAAHKAEGLERARHLDRALSAEGVMIDDREELMQQIIELDANNEAGLKSKYERELRAMQFKVELDAAVRALMGNDPEGALEKTQELEDKYEPEGKMYADLMQVRMAAYAGSNKHDKALELIGRVMERDDLDAEQKQLFAAARAEVRMMQNDITGAMKAVDEAIALAPNSPIAKQLEQFKQQLQQQANRP